MKLKVCGITNETNLAQLQAINPDYLGFIFYPKSKRFVSDRAILKRLDDKQKAVGVFVNEQLDILLAIVQNNQISTVQLHGEETPEYCTELKQSGLKVIKSFGISEGFDFQTTKAYANAADYFLFDTQGKERGGSGVKFDWSLLNDYLLDTPFFLSGGITESDATSIKDISHPQLYAVDINSGFEVSPGLKDIESVNRFYTRIAI